MASRRYEVLGRGLRFPKAYIQGDEIAVHWNGRRGARAGLELTAWTGAAQQTHMLGMFHITLGDFLRGLGLTVDDCAAALADQPPESAEGRDDG